MRAVERTTAAFVASVREALPEHRVSVSRSRNAAGRSNYVYIHTPRNCIKVRISDHAVGMRRALAGNEHLFMHAGATVDHWSVWLSRLQRSLRPSPTPAGRLALQQEEGG